MTTHRRRRPSIGELEAALGVTLDPDLLERALTHRSFAYENGGLPTNERLEFLGDAVLGVVVTDALFHNHPDLPEGQLAKLRASVVNMRALAEVARRLGPDGLGAYLLLGKGEETTGGRDKTSILADTLEALLGAIYLQYGLDTVAAVIRRLFDPLMTDAAGRGAALDWKTSLQELTAALGVGVPEYRIDEAGPDHAKTFTAWAVVAGERYGGAEGRSKKEAEQRAAEAAWRILSPEVAEPTETPATEPTAAETPATEPTATSDAAGRTNGAHSGGSDGADAPCSDLADRVRTTSPGAADRAGVGSSAAASRVDGAGCGSLDRGDSGRTGA